MELSFHCTTLIEIGGVLDRAKLFLPRVSARGIQGIDELIGSIVKMWMPSVYDPQQIVGMLLTGISPIRTVAKMGEGIIDLVVLPFSMHQNSKGFMRGFKSGLKSFQKNTAATSAKIVTQAGHFVFQNTIRPTIVAVLVRDETNQSALRTVPLMIIDGTDRLFRAASQNL